MNVLKSEAIKLRAAGYSYAMISEELGIAKSTLSGWFSGKEFTPNRIAQKRARDGRLVAGKQKRLARTRQIDQQIALGRKDIGVLTRRDVHMIGVGLWLGEGSKTTEQIRFANADPAIIAFWLRWLREILQINDSNITVRMHLYSDSDTEVCQQYWQLVTQLPVSCFRKSSIDKRIDKQVENKGKRQYGTLHVSVVANGDREKGRKLYRKLQGWVSGILSN